MELRVSSPKPDLSPSECASDPDEKEISDDEDDDRNHKHRRREEQSQSSERDGLEQVLTRPYRKRNKPFENGHLYGEAGSQSSETWKNYNFNTLEKDLSSKFDGRRSGIVPFSRAPLDQKIRLSQSLSGEAGPVRGRGGSWSQRDSRFSSSDIASQMVQQGSVPPSLFAGRGMPTVSNAHGASWGAFGLVPGIPNGALDTLHPLGLPGSLRSAMNPTLSMGIPRQRCRDFEERGFCLRGDMCPMEHGVNRIVVEDVQSLSQFNLPVSLPTAHLPGAPAVPGPLPVTSASTSTLLKSKGLHVKNSKPGVGDNGFGLNGTFIDSAVVGGADFYDPDQPLWGNDCSETSSALIGLNQSKVEEIVSSLDVGPSDDHRVGFLDGSDNERAVRSSGAVVGSQSTSPSVWGRISSSKNRSEMREKMVSKVSSSNIIQNEIKEDPEASNKRINGGISHHAIDSSLKAQFGNGRNLRKPSQKAQRTLFVNGIPQQNNKRESLLSHFRKFGDVVDIYIPLNSERAFVQFSRREEAEAALAAPDAVMGNRFIKLWWANRDSVLDDGTNTGNNMPITPRGAIGASVPPYLPVANKGKDEIQSASSKGTIGHASVAPVPASYHPKPVVASGLKAPPPSEKKLESLEVLKEELRKKQQMLDQKRNDFRRQLDKLEKQATKGEVALEQASKKQKVGTVADATKTATPSCSDHGIGEASPQVDGMADSSKSSEFVGPQNSKSNATIALQQPSSLKPSIRPLAPVGAPFIMNRFKLDNRPSAFKILPPLPPALANGAVLKEHFSAYSDLSTVELDDSEPNDGSDDSETSKLSARVYFTTRHSAEKAFLGGKCWNGHNLQFTWLKPSNPSKDNIVGGENPSSSSKGSSDANVQPMLEETSPASQKAVTSADDDSEKMERRDIGAEERMELDESIQSS